MLRATLIAGVLVVVAAVAYLTLWPVPIDPVAWNAPAAPGSRGPHAPNQRLADMKLASLGEFREPEQITVGPDGKLYTGVRGGKVLRMDPDLSGIEVVADTGGRVLGLAFDAAGNLIAADAMRGLLSIAPDGAITVLLDGIDGRRFVYADAVTVAPNGRIYLTDATTRFDATEYGIDVAAHLDLFEQSATGRVIEFDPATRSARVLARGLSFPNGLVVSEDGQSLLLAETARYRIWRIALAADDLDVRLPSDQATVLLDNLPGFPDNLVRGLDGRIWLGFTGPRADSLDQASPFMRKVALRLPPALLPAPVRHGHVMAFTEDGRVVADLQDPAGTVAETTGLTETADRLYVHHIDDLPGIPWIEASRLQEAR